MQRNTERNLLTRWPRHYGLVSAEPFATPATVSGGLRILWVGDNSNPAGDLESYFSQKSCALDRAENLAQATLRLNEVRYDLVLVDLDLPDGSGLNLIRDTRREQAREFVVITSHGSVRSVIEALRYRVFDYLMKPLNFTDLDLVMDRIIQARAAFDVLGSISSKRPVTNGAPVGSTELLIGESEAIKRVQNLLIRAASTDITVLLEGESGTGKEVAANLLHRLSARSKGPFVAYNCAAISPHLIATELFGHERGSFTGALNVHKGIFERAEGGTLFLDEITEMPLDLQISLLRVLETARFTRVGGDCEIRTNVRIVAATNRDALQSVSDGKLRLDLCYRLRVFPVTMPSLRSRPQDIPFLTQQFLAHFAARDHSERTISSAAADCLQRHPWRGNVRELRNAIERAYLLSNDVIQPEHLLLSRSNAAAPLLPKTGLLGPATLWRDVEHEVFSKALTDCGGNTARAALLLGVSTKTVYKKLKGFDQAAASGPPT